MYDKNCSFELIPFPEDAWSFFHTEFTKIIDKHAPFKSFRVSGRHLPWISTYLLNQYKQIDKAWAKYRLTKEQADWEIYKSLRNSCTTKTRNAKSNYFSDSLSLDFNNPRKFWNNLDNVLNKNNKNHITQIKINNEAISDPILMSQAFNKHIHL